MDCFFLVLVILIFSFRILSFDLQRLTILSKNSILFFSDFSSLSLIFSYFLRALYSKLSSSCLSLFSISAYLRSFSAIYSCYPKVMERLTLSDFLHGGDKLLTLEGVVRERKVKGLRK